MVKPIQRAYHHEDGTIDSNAWLLHAKTALKTSSLPLLQRALALCDLAGKNQSLFTGQTCYEHSLEVANTLLMLHSDEKTLAAGILLNCVEYADLPLDIIRDQVGKSIEKLITGTLQMGTLSQISTHPRPLKNLSHLENIRKMLLAMVDDARVVIIKLADQLTLLRHCKTVEPSLKQQIASESMHIYAPLANRLGIGQIKWEIEDLAFRYLENPIYQSLSTQVAKRRVDREKFIAAMVQHIKARLEAAGITDCQVYGRPKHMYSIYNKMRRKSVDFSEIYDANAVRILVSTIENCYGALGVIHGEWAHIPEEFDDYITHPKKNGYRSLHTAVIGPNGQPVEVQIRTFVMHEEAERGVAAHWLYKEGGQPKGYEGKIAWLRQVLEWQKEIAHRDHTTASEKTPVFADRVYVFTPGGDILDLPEGATPLDFAYHIHTEVGHRCKGAKVNDKIVPLTYCLKTGEHVEILRAKEAKPSRDWLNPHEHYVRTSRARAKIQHYFKLLDHDKNRALGEKQLNEAFNQHPLSHSEQKEITQHLNYRHWADVQANLGAGDLKLSAIKSAVSTLFNDRKQPQTPSIPLSEPTHKTGHGSDVDIGGVSNLLTQIAGCCKPLPGDPVVGYITQGRGISIHRKDCKTIKARQQSHAERMLEANWHSKTSSHYSVDIHLVAQDRTTLLKDITTLLANERIQLLSITSQSNRQKGTTHVTLTLELQAVEPLSSLLQHLRQLPQVISVHRG